MNDSKKNRSAMPDPERFMQLFSLNQRRLYGFVRSLVANPADAEDIVQQTLVILWRKFDEFEPGSDFAAWALKAARFEVMNHRRAEGRRNIFDDVLFDQLAAEAEQINQRSDARSDALTDCLTKLPDDSRRLIAMFYEQDKSVKQIAGIVHRSDKTVYRLLAQAHHMLLSCVRRTIGDLA